MGRALGCRLLGALLVFGIVRGVFLLCLCSVAPLGCTVRGLCCFCLIAQGRKAIGWLARADGVGTELLLLSPRRIRK